jgi:hypothetical protein
VPPGVVAYLARQVGIAPTAWATYDRHGRSIEDHRARIRQYWGFREATVADGQALNDFILFTNGGEIATNRQEDQESMMLALHLLQNCLVFINALMIQRVLGEAAWDKRLTAEDLRGLTPLLYSHIGPYGAFLLDTHTHLHLEQVVEAAHAMHEHGAAQVIGRAAQPPRGARTQVQQLALFNAAPEPHH